MYFYRLCLVGFLVLNPVYISYLYAKAETTPLNELSHPDERAHYCKFVLGAKMTALIGRDKNAVEGMKVMQELQSWEGAVNRIYRKGQDLRQVQRNTTAHWIKHVGAYKEKTSAPDLDAQLYIAEIDINNCKSELIEYKNRDEPTPYVVAKNETTPKPNSLTPASRVPAKNNSVQKNPIQNKTAHKAKIQSKQTSYVGNWKGVVKQPGTVTYTVEMNIRLNKENTLVGVSYYPELKCSGSLTQNDSHKNSSISFLESIGKSSSCAATGKIKLSQNDDGSVNWQWFYSHGKLGATATIIKAQVSARMAQLTQSKNTFKAAAKVKNNKPKKVAARIESKKSVNKSTKTPAKVKNSAHPDAVFKEGYDALNKGDHKTAFTLWKKLAEERHMGAQNNLAYLYQKGLGAEQSNEKALYWYRKSAAQGNSESEYNLGNVYAQELLGIKTDYRKAFQWYRKAALQGHSSAQNNLGVLYSDGKGIAENDIEAVKWFRKSALQGFAQGQYNLGKMYHHGEGITQDHKKAATWYKKAKQQGYANAEKQLNIVTALVNRIESPNGMYLVSNKFIYELRTKGGRDSEGDYRLDGYIIKSHNNKYLGELYFKSYWHPYTQQFSYQPKTIIHGLERCNQFLKSSPSYVFYASSKKIKGKIINFYKEGSGTTPGREPVAQCVRLLVDRNTCEVARCKEREIEKPGFYLVKLREDAITLFSSL